MIGRFCCVSFMFLMAMNVAHAQDVPGIEICTAEKTMERRTSCLQSNVEFLQKTMTKLALDHQQKLDSAKAQIDALKVSVIALQKMVEELKAAQAKMPDDAKKADMPPAKDAAAKDAPKDAPKGGAAKDGGK